ncbi:unnamed protein product [Lampetra fluviatilis]
MATKRSGVVSQGERASLAAAEAEDGEVGLPGGGRPAEERDEARASTLRRAEEDAWWQRARKGEEPTRSGMVSASPGEEVEEAPSSAGLQAQERAKSVHQRGIGAVVTTYTPPLLIILLLLLLVLRSSARASRSSPAPAEVTDDASLGVRTVARQRAIDSSHGREP